MTSTVRQLAELVDGKVVGDGALLIHAARALAEAGSGDITFLEHEKHLRQLAACHASAVVTRQGQLPNGRTKIEVRDPLAAFLRIFQHLHARPEVAPHSVDSRADIHATARLGTGVTISPCVSVGEGTTVGNGCRLYPGVTVGRHCRLGDDVVLYPNVVIYDGCTLGHRVVVHANAVIGKDGFGYRQQNGRHVRVPQLGTVEIGDDVEVGAGTAIDRGTFQATRIGDGTKIDNQVQVAHNCRIGRHNLLVSQVGIAGSSSTGDYVVIAGQAGVTDHVHLGDGVVVGAQAGVTRDIAAGKCVLGAPARPEREVKVMVLSQERLPQLCRDMRRVKRKLGLDKE